MNVSTGVFFVLLAPICNRCVAQQKVLLEFVSLTLQLNYKFVLPQCIMIVLLTHTL